MLRDMKTRACIRVAALGALTFIVGTAGCVLDAPAPRKTEPDKAPVQPAAPAKKVEIGKNVFLEVQGAKRRVLVNAYVVQRQARLEQLLCRKLTKEHEAVLAADMDARHIHAALIAAGAEPGSPVQYQPYRAARGTRIKVQIQYQDKGKTVTLPAQKWVRHVKTHKDLEYDWVFAGSRLLPPPEKGLPPAYEANIGDVICVSNFDTALLDLPVASSKDNDDLEYEAATERIPALGTPVVLILEPVRATKKK
jgi:hypothetical protein